MHRKTAFFVRMWFIFILILLSLTVDKAMAIETKPGAAVFVNQLGYLPDLPKIVVVAQNAPQFEVVDLENSRVVYQGRLIAGQDPTSGRRV